MRSGQLMGQMALIAVLLAMMTQCAGKPPAPTPAPAPAPPAEEAPWVTYRHKNADFTLEHPADWKEESGQGAISIHFAHPRAPVHLFVAAFVMSEGSFEEFAKMKFGVQPEIFQAVGPAKALDGPGWTGLEQEATDIRPNRKDDTRRLMFCAGHGDRYVSLTLYADAPELDARRQYYERIFTSLRFVAPGEAPAPSQHSHEH